MSEYLEQQKREEQRLEAEKLQKKQLFAQRVAAAASVASAASAAQTAAEVERMRREASAAAEATARHQRVVEIQQAEMAARQEQMAEEQRMTNFRQTILSTLPLLKEEEKAQYLTEQLLPLIEQRYANEKSNLYLTVILKVFKFSEFAGNFFETDTGVKKFMVEGKTNPKQKSDKAKDSYCKAKAELEAKQKATKSSASLLAAGIAVFIVLPLPIMVSTLIDPNLAKDNAALSTKEESFMAAVFLGSLALSIISFLKIKKFISANRSKKLARLATELAPLKSEMDRETEAFEIWSKKQTATWGEIKTNLVDSYLASDAGKRFIKTNMFDILLGLRMECVTIEQAFLPPSARPTDEQWLSVLKSKVEPEAELAKQRQIRIRDILLSRLVPNYETQQYDMDDMDVKFIDLDLERTDAIPEVPMSDEEVNKLMADMTDLLKTMESPLLSDDKLSALVKKIQTEELDYLRSTIATHSPAFESRLKKIRKKYEKQVAYLQTKIEEDLRVLEGRHPEKFS